MKNLATPVRASKHVYTWKAYESLRVLSLSCLYPHETEDPVPLTNHSSIGGPLGAGRLYKIMFHHLVYQLIYHIEICVGLTPQSLTKGTMAPVSMRCFTVMARPKSQSPCENTEAYPSNGLVKALRVSNGRDGSTSSNNNCTYSEISHLLSASQPISFCTRHLNGSLSITFSGSNSLRTVPSRSVTW